MTKLTKQPNFILGKWIKPKKEDLLQINAVNSEIISTCSSKEVDFKAVLKYGRETGGPSLRKMTFNERGRMIKSLALYLHGIRKKYYPISYMSGATKVDSWIDIDGGIGNLFAYASLRKKFPNETFYTEGEAAGLSKGGTFIGHHVMVPKQGVAVHINAFNFPIWGMLEKIAVNLLAGMPAVVKPSEVTSFLTYEMVKDIVKSKILPDGALQLVSGSGVGILDHVQSQDVVTFTGSASTGKMLKALPVIVDNAVHFNMEADSLNAIVLAPDVEPGSDNFNIFIKEVRKEMTVKAGQKCTAIRRIIVPEKYVDEVHKELKAQLKKVTIGNPHDESVRMGALVSRKQVEEVRKSLELLKKNSEVLFGDNNRYKVVGADKKEGCFMQPTLLLNPKPFKYKESHEVEAFGPVSTIMPYKKIDDAIKLSKMGKGSLVSTIVTADPKTAKHYMVEAAAYHGRILFLNTESAKESTGHGSPMPLLSHGGPGRAGGGEEMGGMRGVFHYLQRTAIQGHPTMISQVTNQYQVGGAQIEKPVHVFRKHFEELEIGETVITAKHTVTEADIVNFANVSGDNFYAHVDETSLEGTIFEGRVAHGYYVLAKAAGLFVDPKKGPVLLNYGIDECRFTKPVYPGMTIGVKLTVKEKIDQEKRDEEDIAKGIVKYMVEVYDETNETVALATILTMVKKLEDK
jgi:oxepin-CoA hydrolase/3-oxo-5,6-dehydrosuberyl-CoA semialdehyde dehydrogenase